MPDEAIYGVRALGFWQHGSLPLFGSSGAGYSALYPVFAGGPLSIGSQATGYAILKVVQALVMSLAAWPVYAYTRRLVPEGYALLAATLTLACPLVLFSGFVMTEVLYYPLAAAALLASARALATATLKDQAVALSLIAVAVATRVQGVVLLAVLVVALLVDAALARRWPDVRRFWPVWSLTAAGALVAALVPGVFGAYEAAVNGSYSAGPAARLTYDHLGFLILTVGVIPAGALVLSLVAAARERDTDPATRALVFEPAESGDFEALLDLRSEAMRESLQRIGRFDPDRSRARFLASFSPAQTRRILLDGEPIGFFATQPEEGALRLDHLYLHPAPQGRGIGAVVLGHVILEADLQALPLRVSALRDSSSNRFYLRHGFRLVEQGDFDNHYLRPRAASR